MSDPVQIRALIADTAALLARVDAATTTAAPPARAHLAHAGTCIDQALCLLHRAAGDEDSLAAQLAGSAS